MVGDHGPHPFVVSTITAKGSVSRLPVNLDEFVARVTVTPEAELRRAGRAGIVYVELVRRGHEAARGEPPPSALRAARKRQQDGGSARCFENQATVVFVSAAGERANVKVFCNGNVQMTGIKSSAVGTAALELVADEIRAMAPATVADPAAARAEGFEVCMINTHFDLGFCLKRDRLDHVLRNAYFPMRSVFESCRYSGVKASFMWNAESRASEGACRCRGGPCTGAGRGRGLGDCRKVTLVFFQSGRVIITGALSLEQVYAARAFVLRVAHDHRASIELLPPAAAKKVTCMG